MDYKGKRNLSKNPTSLAVLVTHFFDNICKRLLKTLKKQ